MIRKSQEKFKDCQGKSGEVMKFYLNFMKVMCKSGIFVIHAKEFFGVQQKALRIEYACQRKFLFASKLLIKCSIDVIVLKCGPVPSFVASVSRENVCLMCSQAKYLHVQGKTLGRMCMKELGVVLKWLHALNSCTPHYSHALAK